MFVPKIGAHVSAAGGLHKAFLRAAAIGANCIQIFGSTPRSFQVVFPTQAEVELFKKQRKETGIGPVFLHAPYLVNLATPDAGALKRSVALLTAHFKISEMIGAEGLIFHIGSTLGKLAAEEAERQVAMAMKAVLKGVPGKVHLIIENASGGGGKVGSAPDEIGRIIDLVSSPRVKVCIDTAHAFEAGLIAKYDDENVEAFAAAWRREVGLENIAALHVNDSKTAFDSKSDRHENIGEGRIGLSGFKALAKEKHFRELPWLLEVPGFTGGGPDKRNVDILKKCF
jgi:deoxyribonuclease-4